LTALGFAAVLVLLMPGDASRKPDTDLIRSFVGCYQFSFGPWRPELDLGGDAKYVGLPERVRLFADRGEEGWERDVFLLRPVPGVDPGRGEPSYWLPKTKNKVELLWNDGFTGVTINLTKTGTTLRGFARTHWDFARASQERAVIATPISCEQSRNP
jgi:hypothetical protein